MTATISLLPVEPRKVILIDCLDEISISRKGNLHSIDTIVRKEIIDLDGRPISGEKEKPGCGHEVYRLDVILDSNTCIGYRFKEPFLEVDVFQSYGDYYIGNDNKLCQRIVDKNLKPDDPNLVRFLLYSKIVAQAREIENKLGLKPRTRMIYSYPKRKAEIVRLHSISSEIKKEQARYGYTPEPFSHDKILVGDILKKYDPVYGFSNSRDPLIVTLHEIRQIS
ncbi:hypothetical protein J4216_06760 [Candidatus Woesearchaeota archaeon]|nr:hypothetical protein [Candidatus Woesearchaeota archaeon]